MDLRVLRYFLTVVREESISGAAEALHLTQPTLSRQLKDLEEEFGAQLFIRGNRSQKISLTEKGMLLRRRAEELIELADKTQEEMLLQDTEIGGDLNIGGGESAGMRLIARAASDLKKSYPNIRFHLFSGNAEDVKERLERGLLDFGVFIGPSSLETYHTLRRPETDSWGLLVREDSPFAQNDSIKPDMLEGIPLIVSRQERAVRSLGEWIGIAPEKLNIVATYNLLFNASLLVESGLGYALCLGGIINTSNTSLRFVPLDLSDVLHLSLAWKKYQTLSKPAEVFLKRMRELCEKADR
ncbi:MAG: LysR family transcriptional regulator [Lachnospiraceae bacterium]|nr:LysR family transcriptional regulator [Lachnospiraceae bacterium]